MNSLKIVKGAVSGAIDAALSTNPVIAIAWGAIKGGVSEMREKRGIELVAFIEQHCTIQQFADPNFVDGIGLTFEAFIRERNEKKREIIKQVFLGFSSAEDRESFELERFYETSKLISVDQLKAFSLFKEQKSIELVSEGRGKPVSHELVEDLRSLASLGLVTIDLQIEVESEEEVEGDRDGGYGSTGRLVPKMWKGEYADITAFGTSFLSYLRKTV